MDVHISLAAEELFKIGPVPVTNSMLTMFIVMAIVLVGGIWIARRATIVPASRAQGVVESLVGFIVDLVDGAGGRKIGRSVLPFVLGIFIFILFANFSGLFPGMGTIGVWEEHAAVTTDVADQSTDHEASAATDSAEHEENGAETEKVLVPFLRAPTADLNMTFALSVLAFIGFNFAGLKAHGVAGRIKHMANPPFLFPIEVIGEFSRILSLSARLFGNVFAGEILLGVMYTIGASLKIAVIPILFPVVFLGLEVLFGTIQALVFALLTLIYIMLAAAHDHDEEEHAPHESGHAATSAAQATGD